MLMDDPGVDRSGMQTAFDEAFDQAVVFHGFTDYMRDYDVFIYVIADPRTGIASRHLRYRFKHCVRASVAPALSPQIWSRSLDERLLDHDHSNGLDGYMWGVKWQNLYPGMSLVEGTSDAQQWSLELGTPFYEAAIETNVHNISLIFADLTVDVIGCGYAPFIVSTQ